MYTCILTYIYFISVKGHEPILLFANRHDLREIHLHSGQYRSVVEKLHSAIALEYDYRDNYIYWSDVASETISRYK